MEIEVKFLCLHEGTSRVEIATFRNPPVLQYLCATIRHAGPPQIRLQPHSLFITAGAWAVLPFSDSAARKADCDRPQGQAWFPRQARQEPLNRTWRETR